MKRVGILVVVVGVINVRLRHAMAMARGVQHAARSIGGLGGVKQPAGQFIQTGPFAAFRQGRFVQWTPAHDAWMRIIATEHLQPLLNAGGVGVVEINAPVAEFSPDQIDQSVGVIEDPLFKHLLVQPGAVEAGHQAQLDVFHQRLFRRGSQDAVAVISLIEHQALEHGLAVDLYGLAVDGYAPQADVA